MIDLAEKELLPKVEKTIAILEDEGHEVIVFKDTYEATKCFIDGWQIDISHYVEKPREYVDGIVYKFISTSMKVVEAGYSKGPDLYNNPKYKRFLKAVNERKGN